MVRPGRRVRDVKRGRITCAGHLPLVRKTVNLTNTCMLPLPRQSRHNWHAGCQCVCGLAHSTAHRIWFHFFCRCRSTLMSYWGKAFGICCRSILLSNVWVFWNGMISLLRSVHLCNRYSVLLNVVVKCTLPP